MLPGDEASYQVLVDQPMRREGFHVKLDRGFEEGTYCAYVEFHGLADRVGFTPAHRHAMKYCALLKGELDAPFLQTTGDIEDPSLDCDPRRKRDLELAYLTFPIHTHDGKFNDKAMKEEFQVSLMCADQQWDQMQAGAHTKRQTARRDTFRRQLGELLGGDAYRHVDTKTKTRLVDDVTPLAFPSLAR